MFRIRVFRFSDLPWLREMTAEAFDGVSIDQGIELAFGEINGHDWRWRKMRHVDDDVARDAAGVFVAETDDGRIIGFISTWCDPDAGIGHIPNVVVASGHRGHGLGRALIEHALQHFRDCGLTHARIETLVQNAVGQSLYTSIGFREVARQIHMAMDLRTAPGDGVPPSPSPAQAAFNSQRSDIAGEGRGEGQNQGWRQAD
jgi:ribosomal protein S18 acetylase RimI-like enzyme